MCSIIRYKNNDLRPAVSNGCAHTMVFNMISIDPSRNRSSDSPGCGPLRRNATCNLRCVCFQELSLRPAAARASPLPQATALTSATCALPAVKESSNVSTKVSLNHSKILKAHLALHVCAQVCAQCPSFSKSPKTSANVRSKRECSPGAAYAN